MRLALVATPAPLPDLRPAAGSLDGDVIRARLGLEDAGFRVVDLDPAVDLAEQIEVLFEHGEAPRSGSILFYASCRVMLSVEGELFLCLDPASPETGDSLRDLAMVFRERAEGPVAFVLECRHDPDPEDPFRSATIAGAAKEAVRGGEGEPHIELLVAARAVAADEDEDRASPLTRALIEALDDPEAQQGVTVASFYGALRENPDLLLAIPCFAHARGKAPFELVPASAEGPRDSEEASRDSEEASRDSEEASRDSEEVAAPAPEPPPPRAPYRSEAASIPIEIEDVAEPPPPRAPYRSEAASIPIDISDEAETAPRAPIVPEPAPAPVSHPLPEQRSFQRSEPPPPPKVIVATQVSEPPPPKPASVVPPAPTSVPPPKSASVVPPAPTSVPPSSEARVSEPPKRESQSPKIIGAQDHVSLGDALARTGDHEGALVSYKRALGMLGPAEAGPRAEIYVRVGKVKLAQDKRREAIAQFEKAMALFPAPGDGPLPPAQRAAIEAVLELNLAEGDYKAVAAADERLLATLVEPADRFARLFAIGVRWEDKGESARAKAAFERARAINGDDVALLEKLAPIYEAAGAAAEAFAVRRRLAELTREPRLKATRFFALGRQCLAERREELGLELLDHALESDPTMLEPLALVAQVLADRQEWSELEQAYRRMLERVDHIPKGPVRTEVTFELCRLLGLLFRDHLEDPALALDAFEDAVHSKPEDLPTLLTAADLARSLGKNDRAVIHLQAAAAIEPARIATYHDLFEVFQKLRRPDQAFCAASVTMFLRKADARERFIFEEHKPDGVAKLAYALPPEGWEWLRAHDRDRHAEAVLAAVTPAAISVRLAELEAEGRLPDLDPAARQDPEKSTVSIVRSFKWASHFLGVSAPAIHLHDDPELSLAAVVAEEPTVFVGGRALRGRSLPELAFLAGRHLAYHVGSHRLLLYYPSIEELTVCFLAAVRIVMPEVPAPPAIRAQVTELTRGITQRISESARVDLAAAVAEFEKAGSRVHLAEWVGAVEKCATRAGYLLAGDLEVAAAMERTEPRGVLELEARIADLLAFSVSDELHALRASLGIAIEP
jgi:tetratricopeptide (TPR) repeat protein